MKFAQNEGIRTLWVLSRLFSGSVKFLCRNVQMRYEITGILPSDLINFGIKKLRKTYVYKKNTFHLSKKTQN